MESKPCIKCDERATGQCSVCKGPTCDRHRYSYVDESNRAITRNSREYCKACYYEVFPVSLSVPTRLQYAMRGLADIAKADDVDADGLRSQANEILVDLNGMLNGSIAPNNSPF